MGKNINIDIERLSRLTHSPKGEYAATEDNYLRLKNRLIDQPADAQQHRKASRLWKKIAIAACIFIISGISYAMIKTYIIDMPSARTMTYHEAPLGQIISDIENTYGVSIGIADTTMLDYRMTAEFSTDEPLTDIIDALTAASGVKITIK
ncbi:MAG: DUF4974 domain-containing protein [Bacteroidales bacterium]|nr:DUF4974 domain-containing protein [Bacteroidales bacterium]